MDPKALRRPFVSLIFVALSAVCALGCSVPVFRYALERWAPDQFEATVFHRGGLSPEQSKTLSLLQASHANLAVSLVDLETETNAKHLADWAEQETETLPWLYVTYPSAHPVAVELASGPFEEGLVTDVLGASVRREIADKLVAGETTVWVLLEMGDPARDEAAWALLNTEIERLESHLELPTIEQEDIDAGLISVDEDELKIAFSAVRLSRQDPSDEMLVRMLLDSEEDLIDARAPIVFPVFGRGRVLYGLVGSGISPLTIETAAAYLVGACSCQVKEDNPGVDLLMATNWDDLVESTMDSNRDLPELAGILPDPPASAAAAVGAVSDSTAAVLASPILSDPETVPGGVASSAAGAGTEEGRGMLWSTLAALVLMLLVVGLGSAFYTTKNV